MSRNIKLLISYDGTDYCGWQVQKNGRTVQGEIERALQSLNNGSVRLTASGRTDSGVHASGQVANFYTENASIPAERFTPALNSLLPRDIRVLSSMEAEEAFHSRFDAKIRVYRYYMMEGSVCAPWDDRYCWRKGRLPELTVLNRIVSPLAGTHDFSAFAAAGDPSKSKVRTIYSAVFTVEGARMVFKIAGNAFLWRMVRSILGTAVQIAEAGGGSEEMRGILTGKQRADAGTTAPARGLFLERVLYDERAVI